MLRGTTLTCATAESPLFSSPFPLAMLGQLYHKLMTKSRVLFQPDCDIVSAVPVIQLCWTVIRTGGGAVLDPVTEQAAIAIGYVMCAGSLLFIAGFFATMFVLLGYETTVLSNTLIAIGCMVVACAMLAASQFDLFFLVGAFA